MNKKIIAYYSGYGMIYITDIKYGIEDRIEHHLGQNGKSSLSKVRYTKDCQPYFMAYGHRILLDDCVKCN